MGDRLSLPALLRLGAKGREEKAALLHKSGESYVPLSFGELWRRVDALALALAGHGIGPGDRVALLLGNRPEWIECDLALLSRGAVDVPVYQTLTASQVAALLADAGCAAVVVARGEPEEKLRAAGLPESVRLVVGADGPPREFAGAASVGLGELLDRGRVLLGARRDEGRAQNAGGARSTGEVGEPSPDDPATILYTSGTTGEPKGVVLTHHNLSSNVVASRRAVPIEPDDVFLSFLPLSHVFERTAGHYVPLSVGATVAYAQSPEEVVANMGEVRPTVMLAVPRFFEKVRARAGAAAAAAPAPRRWLMEWAWREGTGKADRLRGLPRPRPQGLKHRLADRLVLRKMRGRFGGRLRFFVSGGAPLPPEADDFFWGLGVPVLEGYGLTETSPVVCVNRMGSARRGTVGPPVAGVEVKVAADGEILVRGPNVMRGYWRRPKETEQAIDSEGWFHTGDMGALAEGGYLTITDRKKDIIVLATGKNVAPQEVELRLTQSPWISQALVLGDKRPFLVALVVPDFEALRRQFTHLGADRESWGAELEKNGRIGDFFAHEISRAQEPLAGFQRIRGFRLMRREFTAEREEVTPTLKLRRRVLAERHRDLVEALYGAEGSAWRIP